MIIWPVNKENTHIIITIFKTLTEYIFYFFMLLFFLNGAIQTKSWDTPIPSKEHSCEIANHAYNA